MQEGTRPWFELWSPKAPAIIDTEIQPISGFLPGTQRWRRGPPRLRSSPISRAQLPAVRLLIPSSWQMSPYGIPAKCRSQNNCRVASDFMPMISVLEKSALIVAFKIATTVR